MGIRIGLVLGRVLLRLAIRFAPIVALALAGAAKRYRWPVYYRLQAYRPRRLNAGAGTLLIGGGALVLFGITLYLLVSFLAPHA
ncbi:MAG: hypothetical protein JOZ39_05240 [Chloroflexi bacterium]|nr:hypothetical protein [Chloroflexota bacterium]